PDSTASAAPPATTEPAPAAAAPAPEEKKAEAKPAPATAEERTKLYQSCWAAFNVKDWAKFTPCISDKATSEQVDSGMPMLNGKNEFIEKGPKQFAASFPDAVGELQLTLLNGNTIVGIALVKGTN